MPTAWTEKDDLALASGQGSRVCIQVGSPDKARVWGGAVPAEAIHQQPRHQPEAGGFPWVECTRNIECLVRLRSRQHG
eukprot:scaffold5096_cov116-Isochrysis_galbana.AAC.4